MPNPFIIPFFLNHQGCPHRCVYCDQNISGGRRAHGLGPEEVKAALKAGLDSPRRKPEAEVEAAFYGGTFTLLPPGRQAELLGAAEMFIREGLIKGIRISTRPDALDEKTISALKDQGVRTIEIGAQSLEDRVLEAAGRGHSAARVERAAALVRAAGLNLGLQLAPGLPGEDETGGDRSVDRALALGPRDLRLYPIVVLKGTPLARMFREGRYVPLSLEQAVRICARALIRASALNIRVIRMGLQPEPGLEQNVLAGPFHPAFGELVRAEVFWAALTGALASQAGAGEIRVASRDLSQALGPGRRNLTRLRQNSGRPDLIIKADPDLDRGHFSWGGRIFNIYENNLLAGPDEGRTGDY